MGGIECPDRPSHLPDLEQRSRETCRGSAEEAHLPVRAAERRAQHVPASLLAAPSTHRERERVGLGEHRDGARLDRDHRHFASAPGDVGQPFCFELAEQLVRALLLPHEQRA